MFLSLNFGSQQHTASLEGIFRVCPSDLDIGYNHAEDRPNVGKKCFTTSIDDEDCVGKNCLSLSAFDDVCIYVYVYSL